MAEESYDVVIIGAGIQGAGVAQAAAVCGYKTLVIEKQAEAGMATSSKSSKLIHGGLRYLESGQFSLVKECLQERKRLLNNAPELVKLIPFYIPVYETSTRPAWKIFLGLCIYSLFSFKPFKVIKKSNWESLDNLKTDGLKHVFKYYDAQTNDQLLTKSVAASAQQHGAKFVFNADFQHSEFSEENHHVRYTQNKKEFAVKSKYIINCSGPWVKETQKKIVPAIKLPHIDLVAGTHIIIDKETSQGAYYLEAKDKRAVFIIPWKNNQTLIGTTETIHQGSADSIKTKDQDINYLLEIYNQNHSTQINIDNIIDKFTGLRVLPGDNNSAFNKSRDSLIVEGGSCPGLITLIGGKLTAYRASAEQVVSRIDIQRSCSVKETRHLKLGII